MAKSLSRILVHLLFSTKDRAPTLKNLQGDLYPYMSGIFRNIDCPVIAIGGTADHLHLLFSLSREKPVSEIVQMAKVSTTKWIKSKTLANFSWQTGYGAFSVSQSELARVDDYIANQEKYHEKVPFEQEFVALLDRHQVDYEPGPRAMVKSFSRTLMHLVFSTKDREPTLKNIQVDLYSFIASLLNDIDCPVIISGGVSDHIHLLFRLSRERSVAEVVQVAKISTTKWIKGRDGSLANFSWQTGYGAFSVSQSELSRVQAYIADQEKHHEKVSFQEELIKFLDRHRIDYDSRLLWH